MADQAEIVTKVFGWASQAHDLALEWVTSPAAWSKFAILVGAFLLAVLITRKAKPILSAILTVQPKQNRIVGLVKRAGMLALALMLPLLAYVLTGIGEGVTRSLFGSGAVIAFGKRFFLFLAVRTFVKDTLSDPFLKALGRFVLVPIAALYVLGILDPVTAKLAEIQINLGNISFSLLSLIRGGISAALLFWLGRWSNHRTEEAIRAQAELRPATRELATKAAQVMIFGTAFLLLMSIMGIDLTAIAVLGGALGVGIGLGLQQIAANFVSGIILLLEGQTTVGDYVELDGGEKGTIVKMTARACVLETFDGKWIVVPNDHFITSRVVNYSDQGSANRYEALFSVSYETDLNTVPELIERAVAALPFVLKAPEGPDCELRAFGESGVDFAVEYWVNGIDDGKNKYGSQVLFAVWNALKEAEIEVPYPHRVVELRQAK